MSRGKLIIISAPSGTGKSTIIGWLMKEHPELNLAFSISCTSRPPRGTEQNGVEYFFLTPEEFRQRIENDEFLEYEEVYEGRFYGTLKSQVERQLEAGQYQEILWRRGPEPVYPATVDSRAAQAAGGSRHGCPGGNRPAHRKGGVRADLCRQVRQDRCE